MRRLPLLIPAVLVAGCGAHLRAGVEAPDGVRVTTVATGVPRPANIAVDRAGVIWVTSSGYSAMPSNGVYRIATAGARPRRVVRLDTPLGLAWFRGQLYVTHRVGSTAHPVGRLTALSGFDGRRFRHRRTVVARLPMGLHAVDSVAAGPDGRLYFGVGAIADAHPGPSRLSASILSVLPSGRGLRVEARGLRNPFGLAFVPGTRDLLVTDNGRDDLGPRRPPDELNVLATTRRDAPSFGFPGCWGQGTRACRSTVPALADLVPHAAAAGVVVARRFGRYGRSAFVAENGALSPSDRAGNDVVRVSLQRRGGRWVARTHRFARGFAKHDPTSVAIGPDGALYVTLYSSGKILRFAPRPPVQGH